MIRLSVYHFILLVGDENRVVTRLLTNCVQILSTLIGEIIFKLTNDEEYDNNVNVFCVGKFYVKSCSQLVRVSKINIM